MEIWDWAATKLGYSAGTFWYARPARLQSPSPAGRGGREILELPAKVKLAGAVECERMQVLAKSQGVNLEKRQPLELERRGPTLRPRQQGG